LSNQVIFAIINGVEVGIKNKKIGKFLALQISEKKIDLRLSRMSEFRPVQFGKYILLDRIATGGMAELYRAKITGAKGFEKLITIKKILPHLTNQEALIRSFVDEAKLAAFLQHQNIVQIYDFGSIRGEYFIAMEYLFGKDLKSVIKKSVQISQPISLENALHITARISDGLYYAHNLNDFHGQPLNIIHRDIGPSNIVITYDGQVKIVDFGIAKAAIQNTTTRDGLVKGKVAYMSPEQARGENIDHRSDIFSIGIVLYELVTHKRMFFGDTYQVYSKARKAEFTPPESVNNNLPFDLYEILNKALAREPGQRYQSAEEMATDLNKCISRLSFSPSDRTLFQYMKVLFEKEAGDEERAMREAAIYELADDKGSNEETNKPYEKTILLGTKDVSKKHKRRMFLYLGLGAALIIFAVILTVVSFEKPPIMFHTKKTFPIVSVKIGTIPSEKASPPLIHKKTAKTKPDPPELIEGKKLIKEKRFSEAITLFEDILTKKPLIKESISDLYSRALMGHAAEIEKSDSEKAISLVRKSLETAPNNAQAHYMLGRIYTQQKDYSKSISSYRLAAKLNPRMPRVFFNLGYIYFSVNKDYSQAQKMYQRVIELSPPFLDEALYNLAVVQKKLGKSKDCRKNLERAVALNPENERAKKFLTYLKKEIK